MSNPVLTPELLELLDSGDRARLQEAIEAVHPAEIAEFAADLNDTDVWRLLSMLHQRRAAEIFSHFELERQVELASGANRQAIARMIEDLPHDDRVDLIQQLEPAVVEQILPLVAKAEREDIRKLASYEEGTAGALMSSDYATLRPDMTVSQALEQIRYQAPTKETIYYLYVVDEAHRLIGFVSLKDLILGRPAELVREIMHEDVISVDANEDQEPAAHLIEKYDLLALPVTNGQHKLVGIITHDDALDAIRQEQQEDVEKLMAIGGRHVAGEYMRTPAWMHFRNRVVWVVILAILGLVSGFIVQNFEGLLMQFAILAVFMPMLVDTGGNTGSQSATLVVRALAMQEVRPGDILRVLAKELGVAMMLGAVLALIAFGRVMLFESGSPVPEEYTIVRVAVAISVALGLQVVSATLIGALLPLGAARMKWDPAVVASPALTTIVDITGLVIYFTTVKLLLGL